jgi:5-deoxy-5-amino-3-dehydroquinate synthase
MNSVRVELGSHSYDVLVGAGVRHELSAVLAAVLAGRAVRAAVVTQAGIGVAVDAGLEQENFLLGEGEQAKNLSSVEALCRAWSRWGLTRGDVVVAVGGGVVTDAAGFAAAVYHRGVAVVHVPTTLLGQVDAAIGGKTGVNLPEGKNLVGAFWQPAAVLCDTETLATLSPREYLSGCGEMAKYHFLTGEDLGRLDLDLRVARCVAIKAEVVSADERDTGRRALLNYGHTLAHALETSGHYDLRHGEAVAIGLVFAAHLARQLRRIGESRVQAHYDVVKRYDLPTGLPAAADHGELIAIMKRDKKALRGMTFVLDGPGGIAVVPDVSQADVSAALAEMACR